MHTDSNHDNPSAKPRRSRLRLTLAVGLGALAALPVSAAFLPGDLGPIFGGGNGSSNPIFEPGDWIGSIFGVDNPLQQIHNTIFSPIFDGTLVNQGMEALGKVLGGDILGQSGGIWNESLGELGIPDPLEARTQVEQIIKSPIGGIFGGGSNNCDYSGFPPGGVGFVDGSIFDDCGSGTGGGTDGTGGGGGTGNGGTGGSGTGGSGGGNGGNYGNNSESDPPDVFEVSRTVYSVFAGNEVNRQSTLSHLNNVIGAPGQALAKQELDQTQQMVQQITQTSDAAQSLDVTQDVMKSMVTMQARDSIIAAATRADTMRLRHDIQYGNLNLVNASRSLDEITRGNRVASSSGAMHLLELSGQAGLN